MAKILVYGTEDAQIESSFIGDPGRENRTTPFPRSIRSAIYPPKRSNQAVRHMMQLSRHTNDTTHKAVSHMTQHSIHLARMTQLLPRSPQIWYLSIAYSPNH
ncbi:hypothetical protein TNCV_1245161 [Trichonephila clavipes]|nr:hypothetical protein TNCV_1245161 [Trichonephila clavipes]